MIIKSVSQYRQPEFFAPHIYKCGDTLVRVRKEASNGDFALAANLYVDGVCVCSGNFDDFDEYGILFNFNEYINDTEKFHEITARVKSTETIRTGAESDVVEVCRLAAPSISLDALVLEIVNNSGFSTELDLYINDRLVETISIGETALDIPITEYLEEDAVGIYRFKAIAKNSDEQYLTSDYSNVVRHAQAPPLSVASSNYMGGSVGDYALFFGFSGYKRFAEAYDETLTRISVPVSEGSNMYINENYTGMAKAGEQYLVVSLCGAGYMDLYAYDENMTLHTVDGSTAYVQHGCGSVGSYAVFSNGMSCAAVNDDLTLTHLTGISGNAKDKGATANAGDYLLFSGGCRVTSDTEVVFSEVVACDDSLTFTSATNLLQERYSHAGANAGNYAVFVGGKMQYSVNQNTSSVEVYDEWLTRINTVADYDASCGSISATTLDDSAIFCGGYGSGYVNAVSVYSSELIKTSKKLSEAKNRMGAASVGECALFAGGFNGNDALSKVEVIFLD